MGKAGDGRGGKGNGDDGSGVTCQLRQRPTPGVMLRATSKPMCCCRRRGAKHIEQFPRQHSSNDLYNYACSAACSAQRIFSHVFLLDLRLRCLLGIVSIFRAGSLRLSALACGSLALLGWGLALTDCSSTLTWSSLRLRRATVGTRRPRCKKRQRYAGLSNLYERTRL